MTSFNFQSIAFAVLMVALVFVSSSWSSRVKDPLPQSNPLESASVSAQAASGIEELSQPLSSARDVFSQGAVESRSRIVAFAVPHTRNRPAVPAPSLLASAVLVQETENPSPLLAKAAEKRWPMASLTKLMTAVVVRERLQNSERIVISEHAVLTEGDSAGLAVGQSYAASDLMQALLMVSSNDAAQAFAERLGEKRFVDLMQEKAYAIGMKQTSFFDATGLSILNQSTPQDLVKLAAYINERHPEIFAITRQKTAALKAQTSGVSKTIVNVNLFAGKPEFLGGKTGYTDEASGNLLTLFSYRGSALVVVVMGTADRFGETEKLYAWAKAR